MIWGLLSEHEEKLVIYLHSQLGNRFTIYLYFSIVWVTVFLLTKLMGFFGLFLFILIAEHHSPLR